MSIQQQESAGALLFVGASQFIVAVVLSEALHPWYSVADNFVSDLGVGPTAAIFNSSVFLLGVTVLLAAYFIRRAFTKRSVTVVFALTGIGAVGVGVFPENMGILHGVFALVAFLFGALSAIVAYRIEKPPISYISVILGVISLVAMVLFGSGNFLGLGRGGMERVIMYPILLWAVGAGGYLLSSPQ